MEGQPRSRNEGSVLRVREQGPVGLAGAFKCLDRRESGSQRWRSGPALPARPRQAPGTLLSYCFPWLFFHSSHWVSRISSG